MQSEAVAFYQDDLYVGVVVMRLIGSVVEEGRRDGTYPAIADERPRERVAKDGVPDEQVVWLVLREDTLVELIRIEDGCAERAYRATL